jgi:hypothetical protein
VVRIDKTLSELHSLKDNPEDFTHDQLREVAIMTINALHKQEMVHENFVNVSYDAVRKLEGIIRQQQEELDAWRKEFMI